jgi:hypothetical protein
MPMAVDGAKFLKLSNAEGFTISAHAVQRLGEHTGRFIPEDQAHEVFCKGRQITAQEAILLGYRPAYGHRPNGGQKSWYFRIEPDSREMIAVVTEGDYPGEFVWVTTYGRNQQTDALQIASFDMLTTAARGLRGFFKEAEM